jgi:hypothetical protein
MNWKGNGRKSSWPNFKVISQHVLEGTEENHEIVTVRIVGVSAEIRTEHLPKTKEKRYRSAIIRKIK